MLIIIEGPDGAGKTTLVEKIRETLTLAYPGDKVEVLRKGPPQPGTHPLDEYELPLVSYRPGQQHHIICDRWHWGEWIYPDVLGRKTKANRATWYHIELFLRSRGALIVYVNDDPVVLEKRLHIRGDDLIKPEQIARISQRYEMLAHDVLTPMWGIIPHAWRIINYARELERSHISLNPYVTYVGSIFPQLVLVGDVRNDSYEGDRRPAFMPYNATSGHYLLSHMRREHIDQDLGLINANDVDSLESFINQRLHHNVEYVALGANAHQRLAALGYDGAVPHPQYVRRFHHGAGESYTEAIQRARHGEDILKWRP